LEFGGSTPPAPFIPTLGMLTFYYDASFQNQVTATLVGPAVFHGSFYDVPITVQIRIDYLITGVGQEKVRSAY
jgi:hypothetical protein